MNRAEGWTFAQNVATKRLKQEFRSRYLELVREEFAKLDVPAVVVKPWWKAKHGTNSGYNIHRQAGEEACYDCREAHRIYSAERYHARHAK